MQKHWEKKKRKNNKTWSAVILTDSIEIKKKKENHIEDKLTIKCFPERKYGSDLFNTRGQHKTCLDIYYAEDLFGSS